MTTQTPDIAAPIDLATLLPWGPGKVVPTRSGPRLLRTALATEAFWQVWRANKQALKDAGLSCGPARPVRGQVAPPPGAWEVCWWAEPDGSTVAAKKEQAADAIARSRGMNAELAVPAPDGLAYRPYQKAGIDYAMQTWAAGVPGCLNGDEMGLGKTIQGIGVLNLLGPAVRKAIIICPNSLKYQWREELRKWLTDPRRVRVQNAGERWQGAVADVVIVNYDIVDRYRADIDAAEWDLRIVDEAHYCKNPKAKRTIATFGIAAKRKLLFTGTPIDNRTKEFYPLLNDCDPERWPAKGFFKFGLRYCAGKSLMVPVKKKDKATGLIEKKWMKVWDFDGASNSAELQQILRSSIMVRRLKCDVLRELPPKTRQVVEFPSEGIEAVVDAERSMLGARADRIEALQTAVQLAKASDDDNEYFEAVAALADGQDFLFEQTTKLRHETALAKLPMCLEYVESLLESTPGKVIIFAHHLDVVARVCEHFGGRAAVAVVTGEIKAADRLEEVRRFQSDPKVRIFLGNDAAAEGLNLTAASHVVFFEQDWRPGKIAQKEDRAHRIGQQGNVTITQLVLEGSIDANMMRAVVEKMDVADRVLDRMGDGAVADEVVKAALGEADFLSTGKVKPVAVTRAEVLRDAPKVSPELCALAHRGMQRLAGVCDGAAARDDAGFSGVDVRLGHSFAGQMFLSPKQAVIAVRLCVKYRRQLGELSEEVRARAETEGVQWQRKSN